MTGNLKPELTIIPEGLEELSILNLPWTKWEYNQPKDFYLCEQIFKGSLKHACEKLFLSTHPGVKDFILQLRPEPTNVAYYYSHNGVEKIVVLSSSELKKNLINLFQDILEKIRVSTINEVKKYSRSKLEEQLFSKGLKKIELTMQQEKDYITKIFQERYLSRSNKKSITTSAFENKNIQARIKDKMQIISTIKYIKAVFAANKSSNGNDVIHNNNLGSELQSDNPLIRTLNQNLINSNQTKILDCGCGTNGPIFFNGFENIGYHGIDLIKAPALKKNGNDFKILQTDVEQPSREVRKNRYSLILAVNLLETTTRPKLALQQIGQLLDPGGLCVLIFNQYEGSFLITGNPVTFEVVLNCSKTQFQPISGEVFVALDSPTGRDYLLVLKKIEGYQDKHIKTKLVFSNQLVKRIGDTIAKIDFNSV